MARPWPLLGLDLRLSLDLRFGLDPLLLLSTLLGWPARRREKGGGRRDVGWRLRPPIETSLRVEPGISFCSYAPESLTTERTPRLVPDGDLAIGSCFPSTATCRKRILANPDTL